MSKSNPSELVDKSGHIIMFVWRGVNLTMAVFFTLAAYVNITVKYINYWFSRSHPIFIFRATATYLNDPDWFLWVPLYIVPVLLSLPLFFRPDVAETKWWNYATVIHFTLCCAYALYEMVLLFEALRREVVNPLQHEEGREMGGLLIMITWLWISRFTHIGRPDAKVTNRGYISAMVLMMITLTLLPLFIWSLCFVSDWHTKLGHCIGMFS